jgi:hypothetical protein
MLHTNIFFITWLILVFGSRAFGYSGSVALHRDKGSPSKIKCYEFVVAHPNFAFDEMRQPVFQLNCDMLTFYVLPDCHVNI